MFVNFEKPTAKDLRSIEMYNFQGYFVLEAKNRWVPIMHAISTLWNSDVTKDLDVLHMF